MQLIDKEHLKTEQARQCVRDWLMSSVLRFELLSPARYYIHFLKISIIITAALFTFKFICNPL